jgi:hypothetical protein
MINKITSGRQSQIDVILKQACKGDIQYKKKKVLLTSMENRFSGTAVSVPKQGLVYYWGGL